MVPDRFRAQTLLWTGLGAAVLLFGLLQAATTGGPGAAPFMATGVIVVFFFGILRPIQRRQWMRASASADPMRRAVAARLLSGPTGGFWRVWMHLDVGGGDRDRTD